MKIRTQSPKCVLLRWSAGWWAYSSGEAGFRKAGVVEKTALAVRGRRDAASACVPVSELQMLEL